MTDVYRQPGRGCPACGGPKLREFGQRIICDDCAGMLIGETDFADAVHELDGKHDPLAVTDSEPCDASCPRCSRPMETVTLAIGGQTLEGRLRRCARDGVWIPQDTMTAAFARANHIGHPLGAHGRRGGGGGGAGLTGGGGGVRTVADAFKPAAGKLAISQWSADKPRVHTLYVSAFRDRALACPACVAVTLDYHGDRWDCPSCHGTYVEPAALTAMVSDIASRPWELPAIAAGSKPGLRTCPICRVAMAEERVEGVAIDRCGAHGAWFADQALAQALHHAATPEPASVGGWLRKLFGRGGARGGA